MKTKLTIDDFKGMLVRALEMIREREDEFSRLDAIIGDGDHGQAIVAAMTAVTHTAQKGTEFKTMLNDMGFDVMLQVSGSTSTLLGAFFLGMSDQAEGTELDANGVRRMFSGGLANVRLQTQAKPGDKTMMDALVPAVEAIQQTEGDDIALLKRRGENEKQPLKRVGPGLALPDGEEFPRAGKLRLHAGLLCVGICFGDKIACNLPVLVVADLPADPVAAFRIVGIDTRVLEPHAILLTLRPTINTAVVFAKSMQQLRLPLHIRGKKAVQAVVRLGVGAFLDCAVGHRLNELLPCVVLFFERCKAALVDEPCRLQRAERIFYGFKMLPNIL